VYEDLLPVLLDHDWGERWFLVNVKMNFRVSYEAKEFLNKQTEY
jgi:hypothetical protein